MILKQLKYLFLFLTLLLEVQTTHAKTEVIIITYNNVFVEVATTQTKALEKVVQPNVGFLKEKGKLAVPKSVSAQNSCVFSEGDVGVLANGGLLELKL